MIRTLKNLWGEPVMIWAAVSVVVTNMITAGWLSGVGLSGRHDEAVVLAVVAALAAVHEALFTHRTILAPCVQLIQAVAGVGLLYHWHVSQDTVTAIVTIITGLAAVIHQSQVVPLAKPSLAPVTPLAAAA